MSEIRKFLYEKSLNLPVANAEIERIMQIILRGGATPTQIASLLTMVDLQKNPCAEILAVLKILKCHQSKGKFNAISCTQDVRAKLMNVELAVAFILTLFDFPMMICDRLSFLPKNSLARHNSSADLLKELDFPKNHSSEKFRFVEIFHFYPALREIYEIQCDLFGKFFDFVKSLCFPEKLESLIIYVENSWEIELYIKILHSLEVQNALIICSHYPGIPHLLENDVNSEIVIIRKNEITRDFYNFSKTPFVEIEDLVAQRNMQENMNIFRKILTGQDFTTPQSRVILLNAAVCLCFLSDTNLTNLAEMLEKIKEKLQNQELLNSLRK